MGRALVWGLGLLIAAGLAWTLLGQGEVGSSAPSFDPFGDAPESDDDGLGPGLKVRAGARLLAEETESGDASVRGIVLDERGLPLAGIPVTATPATTATGGGKPLRRYFEAPAAPGRPQATAVTDAGGRFLLADLVDGRSYHLQAQVEPPRYSGRRSQTAQVASFHLTKLIVGEGTPFRGRVVDGAGNGLRAWVSAVANNRHGLPRWLYRYWTAPSFQTKPDGRFALAAVPKGTVSFGVTVLGRGSRTNILIDTPAEGEVEIRFEDATGATVTGRVTDTRGGPVGGAQVAVSARHRRGGWQRERGTRVATTDESGSYTVERLIPGEVVSVSVHAEGYIPPSNLGANRLLEEGKTTRLDVILSRGGIIAGRVLDEAGAPIAGATASLGQRTGPSNPGLSVARSVTSEADGRYELSGVPVGAGRVVAKALGYYMPPNEGAPGGPPWAPVQHGQDYEVTEEGQRIELDLRLKPGVPVEGIVTQEGGEPVAGARVELRPQNNSRYPGFPGQRGNIKTVSDDEGRFTFPGLAPKGFQVKATSPTHLSEWVKFSLPRPETEGPVQVVVKEGAVASGRAATTDGTAVAGVTVTVADATTNAVTAADGTYEVAGIPEGKKKVRASVNPRPPSAEKEIAFEWGQRVDGVELSITPVAAIRGVVVDEDGKTVEGVTVSARLKDKKKNRGRSRASTNSKADGTFEIEHLEEGEYTLHAGPTKHDETVAAGTEGVRLTFVEPTPRRVEGRVEDAQGNPVASGRVRVWYGKDGNRRNSTQANVSAGYFRTGSDIKYDAVDLEVTAAFDAAGSALNFLPDRVKDVELDGTTPIVLTLSAGHEIRGRVEDAGGAPIAGVVVRAVRKGSNRHFWPGHTGGHQARSREDGSFRIIGLKDEELSLTTTPGGRWVTPDPVLARPGGADVVIRLSQGGKMAGKVVTVDGEPIAGAQIWLHETDASRTSRGVTAPRNHMAQYRFHRVVGGDGRFEVTGLPDNALYNVTASVQGREKAFVSETIRDVATGTMDLLLRLRQGVTIKGTLHGPEGETVGGAWMNAVPVDTGAGLKSANGQLHHRTGEFTIGPLQPGRYKLTIHIHNNKWAAPKPMEVDAPSTGLKLVARTAVKVEGTLNGADTVGFRVIFAVKGRATNGTVRKDGSFTISGAGSGPGKLFAHKPGDSRYALLENIEATGGPFTLELQEGLSISGRVQGLPENAKSGQVWAMKDGYWIQGSFNASGDFELTGLPPGEYQVSGWIQGGQIISPGKVQAGADGVVLNFKKHGQ